MLHQIGVGVLGPVFRAYHPSRDRPFIVKELRIDVTPEQAGLLVEALERLAATGSFHPAVVVPVAVGLEDGTPYLVQEHIGAESLDLAARSYAAAEIPTTLALLDQLAAALDAAHGRGVLHGALHLRDVFVVANHPRVTGFGIVPALAQVGLRGPLRRPYAAPEQVAGLAWGPAADRFALAAVAYELLTGRRPAGGGALVGARFGTVERIPDAEALHAVFAAALADVPERRPASAGRFTTELRAALRKPADRPAARPAVKAAPAAKRRDAGQPAVAARAAGNVVADEAVVRAAPTGGAPAAIATPRRTKPDILNFEDGEPEDMTRDDHDRSADAPGALPAVPAAVAGATDRPWWWSAAQVTLAVLLILAAAAAYRAGLRLGGDVTPADGGALVGEPPAQAAPVAAESAASRWTATPAPVPGTAQGEPATEASAAPALVADSADPATAAPGLEPEAAPVSPLAEAPDAAPAVVPAAAEGTGWVLVRTTPPGARVTMGGADRGLTPLSISDVPFGSLEIEVYRDGYEPETRQVVVSAAQPVAAVGIALFPLAAAASRDRGGAR